MLKVALKHFGLLKTPQIVRSGHHVVTEPKGGNGLRSKDALTLTHVTKHLHESAEEAQDRRTGTLNYKQAAKHYYE